MVGVDPAFRAEIMLRGVGVELIDAQNVLPGDDREAFEFGRDSDCAPHPAVRTSAATRCVQTVREGDMKPDRSAVARSVGLLDVLIHRSVS
jgi:hypothetical protein